MSVLTLRLLGGFQPACWEPADDPPPLPGGAAFSQWTKMERTERKSNSSNRRRQKRIGHNNGTLPLTLSQTVSPKPSTIRLACPVFSSRLLDLRGWGRAANRGRKKICILTLNLMDTSNPKDGSKQRFLIHCSGLALTGAPCERAVAGPGPSIWTAAGVQFRGGGANRTQLQMRMQKAPF